MGFGRRPWLSWLEVETPPMKLPAFLLLAFVGALFPKLAVPLLGLALIVGVVGLSLALWFNVLTVSPRQR